MEIRHRVRQTIATTVAPHVQRRPREINRSTQVSPGDSPKKCHHCCRGNNAFVRRQIFVQGPQFEHNMSTERRRTYQSVHHSVMPPMPERGSADATYKTAEQFVRVRCVGLPTRAATRVTRCGSVATAPIPDLEATSSGTRRDISPLSRLAIP